MLGINGGEILLLILIAIIVLGPTRMPEYAAKLARGIRQLRVMAEGAKGQLKEQLGPEYQEINWRQYDPRQYDPRRIVRQALLEPLDDTVRDVKDIGASTRADLDDLAHGRPGSGVPAAAGDGAADLDGQPAPYDLEAT